MHDLVELDSSLNSENIAFLKLSIQAGLDGFSFCFYNPKSRTYLGLIHYRFKDIFLTEDFINKTIQILEKDTWLKNYYRSVNLIFNTRKSTLIPSKFFKKEYLRDYIDKNVGFSEYDEIHYNYIEGLDAYNIFVIPQELNNLMNQKFTGLKLFHQATPFITSAINFIQNSPPDFVKVNLHGSFFDIIVIKGRKLVYHNTFEYNHENDFIYYVMNIYELLKLDPTEVHIYFSGSLHFKSKILLLTSRFIKNFEYDQLGSSFNFSSSLKNASKPIFNNLYNIYHCELSEVV